MSRELYQKTGLRKMLLDFMQGMKIIEKAMQETVLINLSSQKFKICVMLAALWPSSEAAGRTP